MRKLFLVCFLMLIVVPVFAKAETNDITIESITVIDETEANIEKNEPVLNGTNIKLDLNFDEIGDSIEYKIIIKNDSTKDYELDKQKVSSDYVEYTLTSEDDNNTIKAKTTKTITLNIQYKNKVGNDKYLDGIFNENRTLSLNLLEIENVPNPETGFNNPILKIVILLVVVGAFYFLLRKKKYTKYMMLLLVLPLSISAAQKYNIKIISDVLFTNNKYVFTASVEPYHVGYTLDGNENFDNDYQTTINGFKRDFFIKHLIEDNEIKASFIGYIKNNKVHYLQGGDNGTYYEKNKEELLKIFGTDNCTDLHTNFICSDPKTNLEIILGDDGYTDVGDSVWNCEIEPENSSRCKDWAEDN